MRDFRKLDVWARAHALTLRVYELSSEFPRDELFGLTSQMRRSASSIPANIAEGCGREGDVELARFLRISMGSASELEYQLLLAKDLGYMSADDYAMVSEDLAQLKRMQVRFLQRLRPTVEALSGQEPIANSQSPR